DIDEETQSTVAGLNNGNYAIAWTDRTPVIGDMSGSHIEASVFSGNGTAVASNIFVNATHTGGDQTEASVVGLSDGGFIIGWTGLLTTQSDLFFRFYASAGTPVS